MAGKDSFVLTADTIKALNHWSAFSGQPKGKKARSQVQQAFNEWAGESALGLAQMSRILALSVD
jgi:hypothetical protein